MVGETKSFNKLVIEMGGDKYVLESGGGGQPGPDTVGTEQIIDGAVEEQDLHDDVKDRMTITHDSSTGGLRLGGYAKPGNVPASNEQNDNPGGGFNDEMQEEEGD